MIVQVSDPIYWGFQIDEPLPLPVEEKIIEKLKAEMVRFFLERNMQVLAENVKYLKFSLKLEGDMLYACTHDH